MLLLTLRGTPTLYYGASKSNGRSVVQGLPDPQALSSANQASSVSPARCHR